MTQSECSSKSDIVKLNRNVPLHIRLKLIDSTTEITDQKLHKIPQQSQKLFPNLELERRLLNSFREQRIMRFVCDSNLLIIMSWITHSRYKERSTRLIYLFDSSALAGVSKTIPNYVRSCRCVHWATVVVLTKRPKKRKNFVPTMNFQRDSSSFNFFFLLFFLSSSLSLVSRISGFFT